MSPAGTRVLIIGGDGKIARSLAARHHALGHAVSCTTRRSPTAGRPLVDLARPETFRALPRCDLAYICAAATTLQACEDAPAETGSINVSGTHELALRLSDSGAFVCVFSTNLVFDGNTPFVHVEAPTRPHCEYGRQKAEMEELLRASQVNAAIIRLTKIIEHDHPLLLDWIRALENSQPVAAFADLPMAPLGIERAAGAIIALTLRARAGTYHLSATHDEPYIAFASSLASQLGVSPSLVKAESAVVKWHGKRHIPLYTSLRPELDSPLHPLLPRPLEAMNELLVSQASRTTPAATRHEEE